MSDLIQEALEDIKNGKMPYLCPEHPKSEIRHEWDQEVSIVRLTGASFKSGRKNHKYLCNACGRELRANR